MLLLMCRDEAGRYAVGTSSVVEVIPCLDIALTARHRGVQAGVVNFRGQPIRVMDLTYVRTGIPFARLRSTRIIVVEAEVGTADRIGWIAQRVRAEEVSQDVLQPAATAMQGQLGPILMDASGMFEWIDLQALAAELAKPPSHQAVAP